MVNPEQSAINAQKIKDRRKKVLAKTPEELRESVSSKAMMNNSASETLAQAGWGTTITGAQPEVKYTGPAEGTAENLAIANQNTITPVAQATPQLGASTVISPESTVVKTPYMEQRKKTTSVETPAVTEVKTEEVKPATTPVTTEVKTEQVKTQPATGKVEITEGEKQAQATGVQYTMQNGVATYNPTTPEETKKILAMGGKIQQESGMTAVAKAQLDKARNIGQMTDTQIASGIAKGTISNKDLEAVSLFNPELVGRSKEIARKTTITNTSNEIQQDNQAIVNGQEPTSINPALATLIQRIEQLDADERSPNEIMNEYKANNPEMQATQERIQQLNKQKAEITLAKMNLYDDYKAKNSSLPISMIMAGYSIASRSLDNQLYLLNADINTEVGMYNSYLDEMEAQVGWEVQQQGKAQDRLFQMYGVTRAEEIRQEDIEREDMLLQKQIDLEDERYERDIAREDAVSAKQRKEKLDDLRIQQEYNIENGLLSLGINPEGMTPEEKKYEYAKAIGKQIQESKVTPTKWEKTIVNGQEVFFDPNTGKTAYPDEIRGLLFGDDTPGNSDVGALALLPGQDLLAVPDGKVIPTRLGEVSAQNAQIRGKECAEYVNDVFQQSLFGNTLADKLRVAKDKQGMIGSAAVWSPSGSGDYGHVGIIVDEDENNWYIKSSNLKAGTVTTDKVPKSAIKGYYTSPEVKKYVPQVTEKPQSELTLTDVATFNNSTYKPQAEKDKAMKAKYQTFLEEKNTIMKDKNADIYDIMEFSQGGKDLTDSDSKTITKFSQALDQIDGIQKQVKNIKTGPVIGRLKAMNPYDTKAQTLSAALNALIPNLARGVYGEVGVLTDNDIRQYAKTIPNLTQTNDVNNAVLALTLDTIAGGYKRQLQTLAAAGKDVSGFAGLYESIKAQADAIKSSIPGFTSDLTQEDELEALSIR